jgi:hypothetical protein
MGTRLMRFFSSKFAISPSGVSGVAVITERVMTSVTLCECDLTYSAASTCFPVRPPGTAPLCSRLGPPYEVALAHDSEKLTLLVRR